MTRAPFQSLVVCQRANEGAVEYLVLRRADIGVWQFVSGGGEGVESPLEAALRETREETGIEPESIVALPAVAYIPVEAVSDGLAEAGSAKTIPEYSFLALMAPGIEVRLSAEHAEFRWCSQGEAARLLEWESNRRALKAAVALSVRGES